MSRMASTGPFRRVPRNFGLRTLLVCAPLAAGIIAWSLRQPLQQVDAWIVVNEQDLATGNATAQPRSTATGHSPSASQITSGPFLAQALRAPHILMLPVVQREADPVAWLQDELVVDARPKSGLVRISLLGREPDQLRRILHSIARTYAHALRALRSDGDGLTWGVAGASD
jgi:hypothetical protein